MFWDLALQDLMYINSALLILNSPKKQVFHFHKFTLNLELPFTYSPALTYMWSTDDCIIKKTCGLVQQVELHVYEVWTKNSHKLEW